MSQWKILACASIDEWLVGIWTMGDNFYLVSLSAYWIWVCKVSTYSNPMVNSMVNSHGKFMVNSYMVNSHHVKDIPSYSCSPSRSMVGFTWQDTKAFPTKGHNLHQLPRVKADTITTKTKAIDIPIIILFISCGFWVLGQRNSIFLFDASIF